MANIVSNLNIKPYYDTTNAELEKGYSQFLAVEDRVLQNRELNVMQGLIQGNLRKITDLIIDNASIASGCSFIKRNDTKQCVLTAGEVYFNGIIIHVNEHVWDFSEVPDKLSFVYLEVFMSTIDEIEDPSLYDPAEVYENHGQPGGHRLKYITVAHIAEEKAFNILKNEKTNIITLMKIFQKEMYGPSKPKPVFGKLYNMLAQRTYDSLGDFLSTGLVVSSLRNTSDSNSFYTINISSGKAYIKGFEYKYDNSIKIIFKGATDSKSCGLAQSIGPDINTYFNGTLQYKLSRNNVRSIEHVNALIVNSGILLSYDSITNINSLPSNISSIYSIDEVYDYSGAGSTKKTYILATDYSIEASNTNIVWKTTGSHPAGTFYVDITVSKEVDKDHYQLYNENSESYILFNETGLKPKNGTDFNISYTWVLSRIDLVYIAQEGFIKVKAGIPNEYSNLTKPSIPSGALPLAYITVTPEQIPESYSIESFDIYRVPVVQLQTMKRKINDFEYNFAMSELEKQAQNAHVEKESITSLRNIFADSISTYNKIDLGHPELDATINIYKSEVTLPYNIDHITAYDIEVVDSNGNIINEKYGPTTLDVLEDTIVDSQMLATHHKDIAPFVFKSQSPIVEITPKVLSHIHENPIARIIWMPNRLVYTSKLVEYWVTKSASRSASSSSQYTTTHAENTIEDKRKDIHTIIGEELVETKMVHISTIPQPFIFEPSYIMVTGKNFLPNTEIRIELDETFILEPEFADTTFEEVEYSYFGERTVINNIAIPPSSEFPLHNPNWQLITEPTPRPTTWKWYKDHLLSNNIEDETYIIEHPTPTINSLRYKYKTIDKTWYYKYNDQVDYTILNTAPLFLKWIIRSPWYNDSVEEIQNEAKKAELITLNTFEPISSILYPFPYTEHKTTVITDAFGFFQVLVKLPPDTTMDKHKILCIPVVNTDFDIDEFNIAGDVFETESYIRNWDHQFYHRKIEQIEQVLYRTYVTTNVTTHYCHSRCHSNCHSACHSDCDCHTHNNCCKAHNQAHNNTHTDRPHSNKPCPKDPLSQTFSFDVPMYLTGIDLYFAARSPDFRSIIFFEITETSSDGFPTGKTIYSQTLYRNEINVGEGYPVTHIHFDHPVFIDADKDYAFIIGASINGYKMYYAKMGYNDLETNKPVLYNPIISGVMLESSNKKTWSAIQDSDLKYRLHRAVFDITPKSLYIKNINNIGNYTSQNFATCNVTLPHVIFDETSIDFEHKIAHSLDFIDNDWSPLQIEERYDFSPTSENITNMKHSVKVTLHSESDSISPIVKFSEFESFYGKYKNNGSYIQIPLTLD